VNTTAETSKSGADPAGVDALVDALQAVPQLLRGFMTIGPLNGTESRFGAFARLQSSKPSRLHPDLDLATLSMGM
jgi:uncharacterized pyridoxal phosphate-containing UPF0001 family protein